jgi:hypothetical protein
VKLKFNYAFQEVDGVSNALVKIQSEIHISALSFGGEYKRVDTILYKVWHRGFLHKLKAYEINGNVLDWFHSYLNEREQRIVSKDASPNVTTI